MKHLVSSIIYLFCLSSCSVNNRIVVTDDSQMRTLRLVQSPDAYLIIEKDSLTAPAELEMTSIYLCEEIKDIKPQTTVSFQIKKPLNIELSATSIVIELDNENIELNSLNYAAQQAKDTLSLVNKIDTVYRKETLPKDTTINYRSARMKPSFIIPENLWDPIIHTNIVKYKITNANDLIEIELNQSEKSMLDKFLGMAIKDRNANFPAIPEGQKKW